MKVLMLCLEFPPVNTTGNYRSAGFARYFSRSGIETVVLTCDVKSGENTFNKGVDNSLLTGLEKVKIYRFPIKPIPRFWTTGIANTIRIWFKTTDKIDKRWYYGENRKKIDDIINKESPDIIYVSLPPFSMARTAMLISRKFNLPLVTDMRDAWSLWVTNPFATRFHYNKILKLENRLFNSSKLVLGVTPELVQDFMNQHPKIKKDKFKTIYNGYDNLGLNSTVDKTSNNTIYKIGYVGSFYFDPESEKATAIKWYKRKGLKKFYFTPRKEKWVYRSPYFFLKTLSKLLEENVNLKSKVFFEFIGNKPDWLNEMVTNLALQDNFINHGFKSKNEVLKIQSGWDAILATSEKVEEGEHFCLPSKLFDGVALRKRIFAFVTPGSQYNFLKEYAQVTFFDPDATEVNTKILKQLITANTTVVCDELSENFTREYQSKKLLNLIKTCVNES